MIESLVKKFGSFTALDGLNLTVTEGEVHGFLGPNGRGCPNRRQLSCDDMGHFFVMTDWG